MDNSICCFECGEDPDDIARHGRDVCWCAFADDEAPSDVDYEYQGRTFEEEVASVGGWR